MGAEKFSCISCGGKDQDCFAFAQCVNAPCFAFVGKKTQWRILLWNYLTLTNWQLYAVLMWWLLTRALKFVSNLRRKLSISADHLSCCRRRLTPLSCFTATIFWSHSSTSKFILYYLKSQMNEINKITRCKCIRFRSHWALSDSVSGAKNRYSTHFLYR